MMYVVDDAADYRFLVQQVFKLFLPHYPLRLFADGLELIQFVELNSESSSADQVELDMPSLIVLDIDMPKLSGFQTLERLKQYPLWQSVPFVMMSSRSESEFAEAAHQEGASAYILKPMGLAELQNAMAQLCHQWLDPCVDPPNLLLSPV